METSKHMFGTLTIQKTVSLNADSTQVWDALTKPDLTKRFLFGCEIISDWKEGSSIVWKTPDAGHDVVVMKGTIQQIVPYSHLEVKIEDERDLNGQGIYLKQDLKEAPNGQTTLTITQGDFSQVQDGQMRYEDTLQSWEQALTALAEICDASYEESR